MKSMKKHAKSQVVYIADLDEAAARLLSEPAKIAGKIHPEPRTYNLLLKLPFGFFLGRSFHRVQRGAGVPTHAHLASPPGLG